MKKFGSGSASGSSSSSSSSVSDGEADKKKKSKWSERIRVLACLSTSLDSKSLKELKIGVFSCLPTSTNVKSAMFDLLITETFDAGLFGEHIAETLDHAHKNLLHNKSKIIPKGAAVFVGLLECGFLEMQYSCTANSCGPLDFSNVRLKSSLEDPYDSIDLHSLSPDQFKILSDPLHIGDGVYFEFEDHNDVRRCLKGKSFR